jgi:hypothetical protein
MFGVVEKFVENAICPCKSNNNNKEISKTFSLQALQAAKNQNLVLKNFRS